MLKKPTKKKLDPRPKAYSYIRMSSEVQLKGDSRRRQMEASAQFAREKGLDYVDPIEDLGISAFRGKNVAFGKLKQFLDLIEEGKVEPEAALILESLDRLSRANVVEALPLLMGIVSKGVVVVTLADRQEYTRESIGSNAGQIFMALGSLLERMKNRK